MILSLPCNAVYRLFTSKQHYQKVAIIIEVNDVAKFARLNKPYRIQTKAATSQAVGKDQSPKHKSSLHVPLPQGPLSSKEGLVALTPIVCHPESSLLQGRPRASSIVHLSIFRECCFDFPAVVSNLVNLPQKREQNGPTAWASTTSMGHHERVPSSCLAEVAIWELNKRAAAFCFFLSIFQKYTGLKPIQ